VRKGKVTGGQWPAAPDEIDAEPVADGPARPDDAEDYAVGYGRPPRGSRFQPGRSGNPKGRPRGDQAFKTLLQRELEERVPVKEQGRRRKLSKRSVIVKRLVSEAMAGNPKHLAMVLAQDPIAAEVLDEVTAALARPADALVKADLIRRLRAAAELEEAPPDRADLPEEGGEGDAA
jgi:hypothetical protein